MLLLKGGEVLQDGKFVKADLLIAGGKIVKIGRHLASVLIPLEVESLNCEGKRVVPGFIDAHVHICGGGGEGGFKTRTPELEATDMVASGVTTVVGCLGTDGVSRSMEGLVAKMYGLREEGVSAYCYTGSYRLPLKTITGDIMKDVMMIEGIIGIGEVAISDHRSSHAGTEVFARAVSDARVAGKLASKCGVCNVHLGDGKKGLEPILKVLETTEIPITQFLPTHMNRNSTLFEQAILYAKRGGYVDFTTSTTPQFIADGEVPAAEAVKRMLEADVPISQITLTSDAQGSLPAFDEGGNLVGLTVGKMDSLWHSVLDAHLLHDIPLEIAIKTITENPANILKLKGKGFISEGMDADLVVLDVALQIDSVVARGSIVVKDKALVIEKTFS